MPTSPLRRLLALGLLAAATAAIPDAAHAASKRPAGPVLTLDAKSCSTGADAVARTINLTASARRGNNDDVQLRFTVQQRADNKRRWNTVFAKSGDLGSWSTSEPGADVLRYTKTINGLEQGTQYRVVVDARGISSVGKVMTRTTRRTYTCVQPQISPKVVIEKWHWSDVSGGVGTLHYTIRNRGREATGPISVVFNDPDTDALLAVVSSSGGLAGGKRQRGFVTARCASTMETFLGDAYRTPGSSPMDSVTLLCPTGKGARGTTHAASR